MNETERLRYIDFLSIGLRQLDTGNYEVAREFIDNVRVSLLDSNKENLSQALQHSLNSLDDEDYETARESACGVHDELMNDA